jgi:cyanophycin synthetase
MKLDIGELENYPTNKIDGFAERIEAMFPSMFYHRCSEGHNGGFFERIKEGTWIGHVVEHIALEIQSLAGMECGYGRTRSAEQKGVYHVCFSYELENAGLYAAEAALRIADALVKNQPYDLEQDLAALRKIKAREGFGPSTLSIINEAKKRNIPFKRLNNGSLIQFGQGANQKKIRASITSDTSSIGVEMACDKDETKRMLAKAYIPVPQGRLIQDESELLEAINEIGYPVVLKPIDGNHGRGITTNIQNEEQARAAYQLAKAVSEEVIVEHFLEGYDYRFLLVNFKLVAVAKRTPAMVIGDGSSTIDELIAQTNLDPNRGEGHEKVMTTIKVDAVTNKILAEKGLTLQSILPMGEILFLKDTANMSTGGTSRDVTDLVHPANVLMAERIARILNLDICGIDVVAKDIDIPITNENGGIVEVNACPGFRMHLSPAKGIARNVAEPVMNMLYPEGKSARIPLVAVTGTNGKTTTTRLIAHIAKQTGYKVGFTTTDGIYVNGHPIHYGDCTGPVSAEAILSDPTVDFAVLETARGGILRAGLGFDHCDVSVITNISDDHLGLTDIDTLSEMAKVKGVVAHSTFNHGWSVLNADDDLVFDFINDLDCNVALFSVAENNPRIARHCRRGGMAAIIEKGYLTVCKGEWKTRICKIDQVPLSFGGKATCMVKNILAAVLVGMARNFKLEDIREALMTFIPSPEQTPGRMNLFQFSHFDVMIDYAHNTGGFIELKKYVEQVTASAKIGIITGVGDRRDEDIRNIGFLSGQMFSRIIIRLDQDLRGRTGEEVTSLLMDGIRKASPHVPVSVIPDEHEALRYAIDTSGEGAFIFVATDNVRKSIDFVKKLKEEDEQNAGKLLSLAKVS